MKIVTDSSVMFSIEEGAKRGLTVLPLTVSIDGETWLEYEDISSEDFLTRVRADRVPICGVRVTDKKSQHHLAAYLMTRPYAGQ